MKFIKSHWISLVLALALIGTIYIIQKDVKTIKDLNYTISDQDSRINGLVTEVDELTTSLDSCSQENDEAETTSEPTVNVYEEYLKEYNLRNNRNPDGSVKETPEESTLEND